MFSKILNFSNVKNNKNFLKEIFWSFLSSTSSQILNLCLMILLSRNSNQESYGYYLIIQSTLLTLVSLVVIGLGNSIAYYISILKYDDKCKLEKIISLCFFLVFIFSFLISVLIYFFAEDFANFFLNSHKLTIPLKFIAFSLTFSAIDSLNKNILIGFREMKYFAIATIGGILFSIPILFFLSKNYDINGFSIGYLIVSLFQLFLSSVLVFRVIKLNNIRLVVKNIGTEIALLKQYALPSFFATIFVTAAHWVCQAMLTNNDNGYEQIAILGISMQWFNAIQFIPMIISRVTIPLLSEIEAKKDREKSNNILKFAIGINTLICLPLVIFISFFSSDILNFYGSSYSNLSIVLILAVIASSIVSIMNPIGNLIAAKAKMLLGMYMNGIWALIFIISSYLFIENGALGVISSMLFSYLLHSLWVFIWVKNQFKNII